MLNVLIVDDDFIVRTYLRQFIDWEKYGYNIIGQASDGRAAYEMAFNGIRPDIIITDVCMPVMGGVELVAALKKAGHKARIIILSCHDDFQYVKKAMQLGADEYFLKNDLQEKRLLQSLDKLKGKLTEQERDDTALQKLAKIGKRKIQQDFIQLLEGEEYNKEELDTLLTDLGIEARFSAYTLFLLVSDDRFSRFYPSMCLSALSEIKYPLEASFFAVAAAEDKIVLGVDFSHVYNSGVRLETVRMICAEIRKFSVDYFSLNIFIAAGGLYSGQKSLQEAYREVKTYAKMQFYESRNSLVTDAQVKFSGVLPEICRRFLKEDNFAGNTKSGYQDNVSAMVSAIKKEMTDPEILLGWLKKLDDQLQLKRSNDFYVRIKTIEAFEKLLLNYSFKMKRSGSVNVKHAAIKAALSYIDRHYAEDLSLPAVAEAAALSPAYFSCLFRMNLGVTFLEYVTNYRIEKVKALMLDSPQKLNRIAGSAGFSDYRHFCKVFKNITGETPKAYREHLLGKIK